MNPSRKKRRRAFAPPPEKFSRFLGANLTNPPAIGKRISNLEAGDDC